MTLTSNFYIYVFFLIQCIPQIIAVLYVSTFASHAMTNNINTFYCQMSEFGSIF